MPSKTKINPTKLPNLQIFNLSSKNQFEIETIIHKNRILWEPWIESSNDYKEFYNNLKNRGYSNIPSAPDCMINLKTFDINSDKIKKLPNQKTMLRKN